MKPLRKVAIISGSRTAFTKSFAQYNKVSNSELLTHVFKDLITKTKLQNVFIGDAAAGAVMKNAEDWNLTRECLLKAGIHPHTPGYDVQRACGTGLETASQIALKIATGQIESGIAGGTDTNSDIAGTLPKEFTHVMMDLQKAKSIPEKLSFLSKFKLAFIKPQFPMVKEPQTGLSMGEHCELMVKEWNVSREEQDLLAFESHQKAAKAYSEGFYDDLLTEFKGLKKDALVRADTSLEKLKTLKPAFDKSAKGTLTAGNSTALTDGASAVLLASEDFAKTHNLPVLAYFIDCEYSAVDFVKGEGLLMAPAFAVSELLKRNNLTFADFDFFEIHEAFAGQVLCTMKAWESAEFCKTILNRTSPLGLIPREKLNVKGGSLALGHPFAATGGRIISSLAKIINQKGSGRGLISICTAGGMGIAAIIEK